VVGYAWKLSVFIQPLRYRELLLLLLLPMCLSSVSLA
jgi:hypothetical protein